MLTAALSTTAMVWKQSKCPITNEQYQAVVANIHNGILCSSQKEQNNAICSNMEGMREYPCEVGQKERDRYRKISHLWDLKIHSEVAMKGAIRGELMDIIELGG